MHEGRDSKEKTGEQETGWGGEGTIERLYLGPDWPVQALSPEAAPRGKLPKYALETTVVLQEENA